MPMVIFAKRKVIVMMNNINLSVLTAEEIVELLPHGSGFNGDWEAFLEDGLFVGKMTYEHMSEEGMYDFNVPFELRIPVEDAMEFIIELTGSEEQNHLAEEDDLVPYFEDTIAEAIRYGYKKLVGSYAG
jgi:hypothetical protein